MSAAVADVSLPAPWKRLGVVDNGGREVFLAVIPSIDDALSLPLPLSGFFKLFIASEVPQR